MANDDVVSVLQELGSRARDSEEGYRKAAEDARDADLQRAFRDLAQERRGFGDDLDRLIRNAGGEPASRGGSLAGAAHRLFTDLRMALSRDDRTAIVSEVARGEGVAEAAYDSALRAELPEDVKTIVQRQHDRVRSSRDRFRNIAGMSSSSNGLGGTMETIGSAASRSRDAATELVRNQPMMATLAVFGLGLLVGLAAGGGLGAASQQRSFTRPSTWR